MLDNKPFKDIEKQAKHVIDLLNQEGARKKAIALKPFVPADPLPQTASKFGTPLPARWRVRTDQ